MTEGKQHYPYARMKHTRQFFRLLDDEPDWHPVPITKEIFELLEMAPSKERELVGTLKFLGIIDSGGIPTKEYDELRTNFKPTLARLVKKSYSKLFGTIPINLMTQTTLVNFIKQQGLLEDTAEYAGILFVSLCQDAGIELPNVTTKFNRARFRKKK